MKQYREIESLISLMQLPPYRKKVVNKDDLRWLSRNLHVKNFNHINYSQAKELINSCI